MRLSSALPYNYCTIVTRLYTATPKQGTALKQGEAGESKARKS